jgi:transcription elongation factor Elf1
MKWIGICLGFLAGHCLRCRHKNLSRVFAGADGGTYVACLECGAKFEYLWGAMKMGERIEVGK